MEELLKQISRVISTKFDYVTHTRDEEIKKPCFQLYLATSNQSDINKFAVKDNLVIQVVFFAQKIITKESEVIDRAQQVETIEQLKKAFSKKKYFYLSDGKAYIDSVSTGYTADKDIYLQLNLIKLEKRDIDNENYELMQEVNLKVTEIKNIEEVDMTWH